MGRVRTSAALLGLLRLASAGCPFADPSALRARQDGPIDGPVTSAMIDDSTGFFTDDVGGQIQEQDSLRAGDRGPTLLEDFIFRQKITHFDHERVSRGLASPPPRFNDSTYISHIHVLIRS